MNVLFTVSLLFSLLLMILIVVQCVWGYRFSKLYRNSDCISKVTQHPHAGIALCVRGADSTLVDCLTGLLSLDYPAFEIRIICDNKNDPSYSDINKFLKKVDFSQKSKVTIDILSMNEVKCGMKNAALIQAIKGFSNDCAIYAWIDSDVVPHKKWLKNLVENLVVDQAPVTCGLRWFCPPATSIGSQVRYIWNTAALTQQLAHGIGWGGSMACCRRFFEKAGLGDLLATSLFEDTLISQVVVDHGFRMNFVPGATVCNHEIANLSWCWGFFIRQTLSVRLYFRKWPLVFLFGIFTSIVPMVLIFLGSVSLATFDYLSLGINLGSILVGLLSFILLFLKLQGEMIVFMSNQDPRKHKGISFLKLLILIPPVGIFWFFILICALFVRKIEWRGIEYKINGPFLITRINYKQMERGKIKNASI